jgi:hypothetical protein
MMALQAPALREALGVDPRGSVAESCGRFETFYGFLYRGETEQHLVDVRDLEDAFQPLRRARQGISPAFLLAGNVESQQRSQSG